MTTYEVVLRRGTKGTRTWSHKENETSARRQARAIEDLHAIKYNEEEQVKGHIQFVIDASSYYDH